MEPATLAESLAVHTVDMIAVFDHEMRFVAVNPSVQHLTGWAPDQLLGRTVLDLLHPEDVERGEFVAQLATHRAAPGGSATFRLRTAEGFYVPCQVAGGIVEIDDRPFITATARVNFAANAVDEILDGLLNGRPRDEVFAAISEYIAWRENGSHVAYSWSEDGAMRCWSTGIPDELTGRDSPDGSVWHGCRSTGRPLLASDLTPLSPAARALAHDHGLTAFWVEPVADPMTGVPLLVSVWTTDPEVGPRNHASGIATVTRCVELALHWYAQVEALDSAANQDELTGLANRRAFYSAIDPSDEAARPVRGGAVLYCDLDGFKPVNDALGHAVGDTVLQVTASRLRAVVREGDLVARLGGDEFAVVLWDADETEAEVVARRLRAAFSEPIDTGSTTVQVGMTVGIAHDPAAIDDALVEAADRALYEDKRRKGRRSGIR